MQIRYSKNALHFFLFTKEFKLIKIHMYMYINIHTEYFLILKNMKI